MILRVYRARASAGSRSRLLVHLRDVVYPANVGVAGLRTFQAGVRQVADDSLDLVLVSTWTDTAAMFAGIGMDLLRPTWLRGVEQSLTPIAADHYELVGEELRGIVPLGGAGLRIVSGTLRAPGGEAFFEVARRWQTEQLDAGDVLVSHIGRRLTGAGEDAVYVSVWRDGDAAAASTEPEDWRDLFEATVVDGYEAVARVPGRPGSDQVLLLADDERRYLYASPASTKLLGRAPARLLGQKVEDLVAPGERDLVPAQWAAFLLRGRDSSEITLARPDGTPVVVSYEARANMPWPGVHASALAAPSRKADLAEALAASGIIAWYEVADSVAT
jgi:PAS domain-containing protein